MDAPMLIHVTCDEWPVRTLAYLEVPSEAWFTAHHLQWLDAHPRDMQPDPIVQSFDANAAIRCDFEAFIQFLIDHGATRVSIPEQWLGHDGIVWNQDMYHPRN